MKRPNAVTHRLAGFLIAGAALVCAVLPAIMPAAHAAPPSQVRTQAPGYYRMMVDQFEVTALYDGYIDLVPKLFKYTSAREVRGLLARLFR